MSKFDFSQGIARLSTAMTSGGGEVPFIAQMHEFAMRESGIPGDEFYTDGKKFVRGVCELLKCLLIPISCVASWGGVVL